MSYRIQASMEVFLVVGVFQVGMAAEVEEVERNLVGVNQVVFQVGLCFLLNSDPLHSLLRQVIVKDSWGDCTHSRLVQKMVEDLLDVYLDEETVVVLVK